MSIEALFDGMFFLLMVLSPLLLIGVIADAWSAFSDREGGRK